MRIFSPSDFVLRNFPRQTDFKDSLEYFENVCVNSHLRGKVYGGFCYGSYNRTDCNIASDIDYFLVIRDNSHKKTIRDATQRVLEDKKVLIQTRVIHLENAKIGLHGIDDSFKQHLQLTVKKYGYKGRNPLEVIASTEVPFKESLRRSMATYLTKLNNGFTNYPVSDKEYVDFLKDVLEKPFHAMRVAIQYNLGSVAPQGCEEFNDTKPELIRIFKTLNLDPIFDEDIRKINEVSRDYVNLLQRQQRGEISILDMKDVYLDMLDKIFGCYGESIGFIEGNARLMFKDR